jgi:hypothetical protein
MLVMHAAIKFSQVSFSRFLSAKDKQRKLTNVTRPAVELYYDVHLTQLLNV